MSEKEFSMVDAFIALKDLDDDAVVGMIKPKKKSRTMTEGKEFPIYGAGKALEAAKDFLSENDEPQIEVIDVDADSLDHIKNRIDYVGQVILRCNRCHANKFIDMTELTEDPEDPETYNLEDECPNCKTSGVGYEMIGQVGKFEEEKPAEEAPADTAEAEEEVAVENDEAAEGEVKFDNDFDSSDEADAEPDEEIDTVELVDDSDEEEVEKDMMETSTSEDDDADLDLPSLGDEVDVDDALEKDDEEDDVKESLNEEVKLNKNAEDAWMMNRVIQSMNNEDAYYGSWLYIWPDGETREMCAYDFSDDEDYDELRDTFERTYRRYHNDGLYEADDDVVAYAHKVDSLMGLAPIENYKRVTEEIERVANTSIHEVLGSVIDPDFIKQVIITNNVDGKAHEVFNGAYVDIPMNLASAECKGFDVADHNLACTVDTDVVHDRVPLGKILSKFTDEKTDKISLTDVATSDEVFSGNKSDAIEKFGNCGFISIDTPAVIRLIICDPSIITTPIENIDPEEQLVERIFEANGMSKYRVNRTNSTEFWIRESIMLRDDLELIYESYVKPIGDKALVADFKKLTGYSNPLEEALEQAYAEGYAAANKQVVTEAVSEREDETFEFFVVQFLTGDEIAHEDFLTVYRHGDIWTAIGDKIQTSEHDNLIDCLLDAMSDADKFDRAEFNDVQFEITDDLDAYMTDEQKKQLVDRSGMIVEELEADTKFVIVAVTNDGARKFYSIDVEDFVDDISNATIYVDHDDAIDDWRNIDKSKYRRVFVPNYDPEVFGECMTESYVSRDQMIGELKKAGKHYNFNRYTDAQIFRMYQKYVLDAKKPEPVVELNVCEKCGGRLNDSGSCPACDHGEEDLSESLDTASAVAEAIKHVASDYGISPSDEEFSSMVFDYICDHLDAGMPEDANEFKAWENDLLDEIADQVESINASDTDVDSDDDIWDDEETIADDASEPEAIDLETLKSIVDNEIEFAVKEWGTSISKLVNHFLTILQEGEFGYADPEDLKQLIAAHVEKNSDLVEQNVRSFKTRKELAEAIEACKNNSRPYTIKRSLKEGYRYDLIEEVASDKYTFDDLYMTIQKQDNVDESLGDLVFRNSLAQSLYDEFYAPLRDMIKRGDKKAAIAEWEELTADLNNPAFEKKWKQAFIDEQRARLDAYKAEIDALDEKLEEDTDVVPAEETDIESVEEIHLTDNDRELAEKVLRVSQDISAAIKDTFDVDIPASLIVADIFQDLRLIAHQIDVSDLADTPINNMTAEMFRSYEEFYVFMDTIVSALTGETIRSTPEMKLKSAVKMLDGPNFSRENIIAGIQSPQFRQLAIRGQVPFLPAESAMQLEDYVEIDEKLFDDDINAYFNEAYDETVLYTTTKGKMNADGSIELTGLLESENSSSDVTFKLMPVTKLDESLSLRERLVEAINNATYKVTNNLSDEEFEFRFSK